MHTEPWERRASYHMRLFYYHESEWTKCVSVIILDSLYWQEIIPLETNEVLAWPFEVLRAFDLCSLGSKRISV